MGKNLAIDWKKYDLPPRIAEVVGFVFANPQLTYESVGSQMGISKARVSKIMNHPKVSAAFPLLARRHVRGMLPRAVVKLNELMLQTKDLSVSAKVTLRILDSEKALEPQEIKHTHTMEFKTSDELTKIVNRGRDLPSASIDTELVTGPDLPD